MADETTMTREQELAEQFKAGLDPAGAVAMAGRVDMLEKEVEQLQADLSGASAKVDELTVENKKLDSELGLDEAEKIDLEAQADKLQKDLDAANARATAMAAELEAANAKVAVAEKAVTTAKAAVTRGEKSTKPRKFGAMDGTVSGDTLSDALAKADADDKKVEIVFSDGKREISGIAPIAVVGDVWRQTALGRMLKDPVLVHGPAVGEVGFTIDGYALLIDGKQVAYCKRSDVINVAPGGQANIADDIYF